MTRVRGIVLIVIGAALAVAGVVLVLMLAPTFLHPGQAIGGTTFTGPLEMGQWAIALLAWLIPLGVSCVVGGVHLVKHEELGTVMGVVLAVAFAVLLGLVWEASRVMK